MALVFQTRSAHAVTAAQRMRRAYPLFAATVLSAKSTTLASSDRRTSVAADTYDGKSTNVVFFPTPPNKPASRVRVPQVRTTTFATTAAGECNAMHRQSRRHQRLNDDTDAGQGERMQAKCIRADQLS